MFVAIVAGVAWAGAIEYPVLGNLRWEEGTIEFWITPTRDLYPDIGTATYAGVFSLFSIEGAEEFNMSAGWGMRKEGGGVHISMSMPADRKALLPVRGNIKGWKIAEKHHIAFTWKGREMRLYADGKEVGGRNQAALLAGRLAGARLLVGNSRYAASNIILHAVRTSGVARTEEMLRAARPEADLHTLLLDRIDSAADVDEKAGTTKAEQISGLSGESGGVFKNAKFVAEPTPGLAL